MKFTRKTKIYSIITSLMIGALLITGFTLVGSNSAFAADTAKKIQASITEITNELTPGKVLHIQKESYTRHGPASSKISKIAWTKPENAIIDYYFGPVDENGDCFTAFQIVITKKDGEVVQTVNTVDGEIIYQDQRFGETEKSMLVSLNIEKYLQTFITVDDQLLNERWEYIGSKTDENGEVLIFEQLGDWVLPEPYPGTVLMDETNGVNIPYTLDLEPVKVLGRIEISTNDYLLNTHQIWIIDSTGEEILLIEDKWNYFIIEVQ